MEELQDRLVIVLLNLPKSKLRGLESFAMVMCASNADGTVTEMVDPPPGSKPGDAIVVKGYDRVPDVEKQISKKKYKKVWEAVQVTHACGPICSRCNVPRVDTAPTLPPCFCRLHWKSADCQTIIAPNACVCRRASRQTTRQRRATRE